jgi:hypothetical protein
MFVNQFRKNALPRRAWLASRSAWTIVESSSRSAAEAELSQWLLVHGSWEQTASIGYTCFTS